MRRRIALAFLVLPAVLAPGAAAAVQPYGKNDAGGFRNILPPGQKGTDNAVELAAFQGSGAYPEHWDDQQALYDGLIQAAPKLRAMDIPDFFKDATFGVRPGKVESTITPRPGVTIIRDEDFGVPHIYGETRADTMFGAGYANATDRLFFMDILRHTGRAKVSSFVGGSPGYRQLDHNQWQYAPYTDEELLRQFNLADDYYGAEGTRLQQDVLAYLAGVNAYIEDAYANPSLMPAEYAAIGKLPQPWNPGDLVAEASLIGGEFGRGGGKELDSALALLELQARFGKRGGRRAWADFRMKNDPEAPTTVAKRYPYQTANPFSRRGIAIPDRGSVRRALVAPIVDPKREGYGDTVEARQGIMGPVAEFDQASNWLLISARESRTGRPIGVLGPQVDYYEPQVLMEMGLHGPGIDAQGATFPGVGLYVLLGHGRDYAWSATTATSDNVDTFAEVLCKDDYHYLWRGRCRPMEKLVRVNSWTPNAADDTPPGSETLTAYRTVHGIVYARGRVRGRKVAFVNARSTYFHEADSALFFSRMNNPNFMRRGPKAFYQAAKKMNLIFNWSYLDSRHIAYQLTGWYPKRAPGTSPDFPILGTGQYDWQGFDPRRHRSDAHWLAQRKHPHAVNPRYLLSWNNKQAPGWAAADDKWSYGPLQRSQMIEDKIERAIRGPRKMSLVQLVRAMQLPATQDLRGYRMLPLILRTMGRPRSAELRAAAARLRAWRRAGSHRRDLNLNGRYEHERAVIIMDAWWPKLVRSAFRPALGGRAYDAVRAMHRIGDPMGMAPDDDTTPAFSTGWWGYLHKDLRTLLGKRPPAWRRSYCGRGSRRACARVLRASLRRALDVSRETLYGYGDCEEDPAPDCFDRNRPTRTSGIAIGDYPFQNRPTFQQTVSIRRGLR